MSRTLLVLAALLVILAPFREGGRDPLGLLVLHTLVVLFVLVAFLRAAGAGRPAAAPAPARGIAALAAAAVGLAGLSALRAAYPLAAALGLLDLAAAAALFAAAIGAGASAADLGRMRLAAIASTSLQAVLALVHSAGGTHAAGAAFLNPNHLAAFLNLGLLLCVAAADRAQEEGARRAALLAAGGAGLHLLAVGVLASRGALLGLTASLALLVALRLRAWPRRARAAALAAAALMVAVAAGFVAQRFARWQDPLRYQRIAIWRASAVMLAGRPLLGHGPGMFRHLSDRYSVPLDRGPIRFERRFASAHAAPLTLAAEIGLPAVACLLAAAGLSIRRLLRDREGVPPGIARGLALALTALLAHAAVEDLQERPALVLVPVLLAGLVLGAPTRGGDGRGDLPDALPGAGISGPAPAGRGATPGPEARGAAFVLAGMVLTGAVLLPYLADRDARAAVRAGPGGLALMERAARLNPLHPEYRHDLAMAALNAGPLTASRYAEAALDLREARRLKPIDARFPLLLARLLAQAGGPLFADATSPARAAALYREAAGLAPLDPRPRLELAGHLAAQERREEGLEAAGDALRLEPHFVRARILQAALLLDLGREREGRAAFEALAATDALLRGYVPASGYARDVVRDAPEERLRLERRLSAGP